MTRAERRFRRQRKVARAAKALAVWNIPTDRAAYWADNMAKCGCWMCNGRARWTKPEVDHDWDEVETGE